MNIIDLNKELPVNTAALREVVNTMDTLMDAVLNETAVAVKDVMRQVENNDVYADSETAELKVMQLMQDNNILSRVKDFIRLMDNCKDEGLRILDDIDKAMSDRKKYRRLLIRKKRNLR